MKLFIYSIKYTIRWPDIFKLETKQLAEYLNNIIEKGIGVRLGVYTLLHFHLTRINYHVR